MGCLIVNLPCQGGRGLTRPPSHPPTQSPTHLAGQIVQAASKQRRSCRLCARPARPAAQAAGRPQQQDHPAGGCALKPSFPIPLLPPVLPLQLLLLLLLLGGWRPGGARLLRSLRLRNRADVCLCCLVILRMLLPMLLLQIAAGVAATAGATAALQRRPQQLPAAIGYWLAAGG